MKRRLGLLALVVFALSAVFAASVQAEAINGGKEAGEKVTFTGNQVTKNVFKITAGSIQCGTATYKGTAPIPTASLKLTPTFGECTCLGFSCTADVNECSFVIAIGGKAAGEDTVDLICPGEKELTFTATSAGTTKCTIHYPSQLNAFVITHKNVMGEVGEVEFTLNVQGQAYFHTKGTGLGACTEGFGANGTWQGSIRVKAEEDKAGGAPVGISIF